MPDENTLLSAFSLTSGSQMAGGFTLHVDSATHQSVVRYREYYYSFTFHFTGNDISQSNVNQLIADLHRRMFPGHEVIAYGIRNPYRCVFDSFNQANVSFPSDKEVIVNVTAHSYRV